MQLYYLYKNEGKLQECFEVLIDLKENKIYDKYDSIFDGCPKEEKL